MPGLFVAVLFTSAMLLFWVQPMVARMLLPLLGGTPAVWNVCLVFFQTLLLAGYAYAHFLTTRLSARRQILVHLALLLAVVIVLPTTLPAGTAQSAPWQSNPVVWLLRILTVMVALPFFILSASAPLLQSWFSRLRHRSSGDPYFLYAASNLGSLVGLIGYPTLIEPNFTLPTQRWIWSAGYGVLLIGFAGSAVMLWRRQTVIEPAATRPVSGRSRPQTERVDWPRRLSWIFWAFIPSSLMLGITTYLSTDIASVPLRWVIPLGIYLLTFILVFNRRRAVPLHRLERVLPPLAVILIFVMLNQAENLAWLQMGLHLLFFFLAALLWHTRLANDRPSSRQLTDFYFCLSIGGVLGGLFNALLAPVIFHTVVEYRLTIVLACILWPAPGESFRADRKGVRDLAWPAGIGLLTLAMAMLAPHFGVGLQLSMMIVFGVPAILCYVASRLPGAFSFPLSIAAVLLASGFYAPFHGRTLYEERNFFGSLRVAIDPGGRFRRLYHGTTIHGMEFIAPEHQGEPLAYYHRAGPCGQAMAAINSRPGPTSVAVIGLGAGSMAAYAQPGQHWTFYEINPAVIRLAENTNYFTFLHRCTNASVDFKLGDARLRLREAATNQYDLIVGDAFGSDAPPLHLLNREALALYLSKLSPDGVLLLHISSRFLDFRPVIGNLAAYFQLPALVSTDDEPATPDGKLPSSWVALARHSDDFGPLRDDPRWQTLPAAPGMRLWTDDYSNILGIFDWQ